MAWVTPKTTWAAGDAPVPSDFNRIEGNIQQLYDDTTTGKNTIASAITSMGQTASGSETYAQLAAHIQDISNDANAAVGDVLSGKTFYQGGAKRTGTMPNRGAYNITPGPNDIPIPAGYHNGLGVVYGISFIESIQYGSTTMSNKGTNYLDVAINTVDRNRSIVYGYTIPYNYYSHVNNSMATIQLLDDTHIRIEMYNDDTCYVYWAVVQFKNVKSLQRGKRVGIGYQAINTIDINKALVFATMYISNYTDGTGYTVTAMYGVRIYNSTNLVCSRAEGATTGTSVFEWQVVEFN